jgi:hypothetical protein
LGFEWDFESEGEERLVEREEDGEVFTSLKSLRRFFKKILLTAEN